MKVSQNMRLGLILYFAFLIVIINSCSIKNQSNPETQKVQVQEEIMPIDTELDTSLRLKFSTGVRSILEDDNGNIWFGSHQEGVCLFDGKKMTYFTTEDGLSDNQVRSIFKDSTGRVWFEGGRGISSYDGKKIITHTEKNYDSKNEWQAGTNDIWFKGDEEVGYNETEKRPGVYRYDGKTLNYHVLPIEIKGNGFTYSVSTPFARGKNGMVWFGTYGAVVGYGGTSGSKGQASFTIIDDKSLGFNEMTGFLHVRSIFEDSKGKLWIGNNGIGVLLYDGDTTINFSKSQGLLSLNSLLRGGYKSPPISLEHVFSIGEDPKGNIWFGDRDTGAWRYDGKSMKNYTQKDGLTTTHIWQIYNTKKGELWFAMDNGNVLQFNGESFERVF